MSMSDASVCSEGSGFTGCSEVMVLDEGAVSVISTRDEGASFPHRTNKDDGAGDTYPPSVGRADGGNNDSLRRAQNFNNDDGGDDLAGLAMLVGATVRDRVVLQQIEEIRALRAQLAASHRVEVTGPNGAPVLARGTFSEGDFNPLSLQCINDGVESEEEAAGPYWDVGLDIVNQGDGADGQTVPLNKLAHVEIRVGGVLYATSSEVERTSVAFGIRPGNKFDLRRHPDMSRSAVAEFNSEDGARDRPATTGGRAALMTFHLPGFPRGHWRSLRSVAMLNRSIELRRREREGEREERRERRRAEREGGAEGEDYPPGNGGEDYESDDESEYDEEEDQDPLDVYNYLTLCLSKRHPEQRADVTSVSLCARSVRGRIESLVRGEEFRSIRKRVLKRIDDMHREEQEGMRESLEEALANFD